MKTSKKLLTIIALATITLAIFTACSNPVFPKLKDKNSDRDAGKDLAVTITAAFGEDGRTVTITADVTGEEGGTLSYQWYKNSADSSEWGTALSGETEKDYQPPVDTVGTTYYYVKVTTAIKGQTVTAASNTVGIIVHANNDVEIIVSDSVETPVVTIAASNDGAKVTLTAAASVSDGGTLTYQWYKNTGDNSEGGTALSGETRTTYTPPTNADGTTYYYVRATNTLRGQTASAASNTARVTIQGGAVTEILVSDTVETPKVSITATSSDGGVILTTTAAVSDEGTLTYQWYRNTAQSSKNGALVTGATGTTYTPPTGVPGTMYYYVKVTNTLKGQTASAVSNTARIVVREGEVAGEVIIEEIFVSETVDTPVAAINAVVNSGRVTLTAAVFVGDGGTVSYQWYKNTVDRSKNGALIANATGTTYIPPTTLLGTTYYYVKVTNTLKGQTASAVSNILGIVIHEGEPVEIIEVVSVEIPTVAITSNVEGVSVTLTADASVGDSGTLSYQWYRNTQNNTNGTTISGATETTYTPSTEAAGTAYYYVKVTNTLDEKTAVAVSNILGVIVREEGTIEILEVVPIEIPVVSVTSAVNGATVILMAAASVGDGGELSYQWYRNSQNNTSGTAIFGATWESYTPSTGATGTTYYYVRATNTRNGQTAAAVSNIVGVSVQGEGSVEIVEIASVETPEVTITSDLEGQVVTFTADASVDDGGELSYQWYRNTTGSNEGTALAGETETTYMPPTHIVGTAYYYVRVTNTLNGKTAIGVSNILGVVINEAGYANDTIEIFLPGEVPIKRILSVAITVTSPLKDAIPDKKARPDGTGYTCDDVEWSSEEDTWFFGNMLFGAGKEYTATVTLIANNGYAFADTLTAKINNADVDITSNEGSAAVIALTFDATLSKNILAMTILNQPTKLSGYVHGDALDLDGLNVQLTFDDQSTQAYPVATFKTLITTNPTNGAILSRSQNNGKPVVITAAGGRTINTDHLTIDKADPIVEEWPSGFVVNDKDVFNALQLRNTDFTSRLNFYNNSGRYAGKFSWTNPTTSYIERNGPSFGNNNPYLYFGNYANSLTFTPTDTENYNTITNDVNIFVRLLAMVEVSAVESFQMGRNGTGSSGNVTPLHTVKLNRFYMSRFEISQRDYLIVRRWMPSAARYFSGTGISTEESSANTQMFVDVGQSNTTGMGISIIGFQYNPYLPVENVTWYDAVRFCNALSQQEGLDQVYTITGMTYEYLLALSNANGTAGAPTVGNASPDMIAQSITSATVTADFSKNGYRLPTEAEWEYMAKGGRNNAYDKIYSAPLPGWASYGSDTPDNVWYSNTSGNNNTSTNRRKHRVNTIQCFNYNFWAHLSGNVAEWVWDWYGPYTSDAKTNPTGPATGTARVVRGGHFESPQTDVRAVSRSSKAPGTRDQYTGFRVVRNYE